MSNPSLLDMAAEVRAQRRAVDHAIATLRESEVAWTTYQLLAGEVEEVAFQGLRTAWTALQRVEQLAKEALPS